MVKNRDLITITTIEVFHELVTTSRHDIITKYQIVIENEDGTQTLSVYGKGNAYELVQKLQEAIYNS